MGPTRGLPFGYGHNPWYAAIAAVGARWHVAASDLEHESTLTETDTVLAVAVPLFVFIAVLFWLAHWCLPGRDRFHMVLLTITSAIVLGTVVLADLGMSIAVCLVVLMLEPWVLVIGWETRGHGRRDRVLTRMRAESEGPNAPASSALPAIPERARPSGA